MNTAAHPARRCRSAPRHALTLVELIIGLVITSVLLLALGAFSSAVGTGWRHSNQAHALGATSRQIGARVEQIVRGALRVAQTKPATSQDGNSYLFYWAHDGFGGTSDGLAQVGEMGLLEYDEATQTIWLYEPLAEAAMDAAQLAEAQQSNWGDLSSPAVVSFFKTQSCVAPARALAGRGSDVASRAAIVTAGSFESATPENGSPLASYRFTIAAVAGVTSADSGTVVGSVALRSPITPGNAGSP